MDDLIRLLPKILRATDNSEEMVEAAALAAWRRAAGEGLREHAVPFRLYGKTFVIAVPDLTWRRQLEKMSGQLLFRLNSLLGQPAVTYLEFRIDPETVEAERDLLRGHQRARQEQEQRALLSAKPLDAAAASIKDEDLRRKFLIAAGSCIDRLQNGR